MLTFGHLHPVLNPTHRLVAWARLVETIPKAFPKTAATAAVFWVSGPIFPEGRQEGLVWPFRHSMGKMVRPPAKALMELCKFS